MGDHISRRLRPLPAQMSSRLLKDYDIISYVTTLYGFRVSGFFVNAVVPEHSLLDNWNDGLLE